MIDHEANKLRTRIADALERIATALESKKDAPPVDAESVAKKIDEQMRKSTMVIDAERGLTEHELRDRCKCGHVAKHHDYSGNHPCLYCDCKEYNQ